MWLCYLRLKEKLSVHSNEKLFSKNREQNLKVTHFKTVSRNQTFIFWNTSNNQTFHLNQSFIKLSILLPHKSVCKVFTVSELYILGGLFSLKILMVYLFEIKIATTAIKRDCTVFLSTVSLQYMYVYQE